MKALTVASILLAAACASAAQQPATQPASTPAAPPEISTIAVPIRASLAPLLPQLETQVPKTIRDTVTQNGFTIGYSVVRDPVGVTMIGRGLHASTTAHYSVKVCRGNLPCISCGIDEPPRRAEIALQTILSWDAAWRIRSKTAAQPSHFPNRCRMSFLQYDVTDRFIAPVVDDQLRTAVKVIDKSTPGLTNLRGSAQQIWTSLQRPYEIAPHAWLLFEPFDVGLAPLTGNSLAITTTLTIRARSRIVVGARPAVTPLPLPALQTREASGGVRIPFDIQLPWEEATRLANERFGNRTYKVSGSPLTVGAIRIAPAAEGRIAVDADIDYRAGRMKSYRGPVHLEGTPRLDPATNSIVVPDLDYTLEGRHRNLFLRTAERFVHDDLRDRLRASANLPLAGDIAKARVEVTAALARPLARGVRMQGRIDSIEPVSVTPLPENLRVGVVLSGVADVQLTP